MNEPVVVECSWIKDEPDDPFVEAMIESISKAIDLPPELLLRPLALNWGTAG
jgi:hypothetical protein